MDIYQVDTNLESQLSDLWDSLWVQERSGLGRVPSHHRRKGHRQ